MINNKTKLFLLFSIIFFMIIGISAISAADNEDMTADITGDITQSSLYDIPTAIDDNKNIQNIEDTYDTNIDVTDNTPKTLKDDKNNEKQASSRMVAALSTSKSTYTVGENVDVTLKLSVENDPNYDFGDILYGGTDIYLGTQKKTISFEWSDPVHTTSFSTNSMAPGNYNLYITNFEFASEGPNGAYEEYGLDNVVSNNLSINIVDNTPVQASNIVVDSITYTTTQNAVLTYNNTDVTVVLSNDGAVCDEASVTLTIDDESKTQSVYNLDDTPQNLIFNYYFTTKGDKEVSVVIDYLNGTKFTAYTGNVNVIASGYMGKSFSDNKNMTMGAVYEGYNTLNVFANLFDYKSNQAISFTFDAAANGLTDSDKIVDVLYYQPWGVWNGQSANIIVKLNDEELEYVASYKDQKGFGGYDFPYGLYVYNITDKILANNQNSFNIAPVSGSTGYAYFYGGYIIAIYENSTKNSIISIAQDCDALSAGTSSSYGATPETAISYANFNNIDVDNISNAHLTVMANNANTEEYVYINDNQKALLKDYYNFGSQVSVCDVDVTDDILEDNVVAIKCIKDTSVYALTSILVVEYDQTTPQSNIQLNSIDFSKKSNKIVTYDDTTVTVVLDNDGAVCDEAIITLTIDGESKSQSVYNIANTPQTITFDYYFTMPGQKSVTVTVDYLNTTQDTIYADTITVSTYYTTVASETLTTKATGTVTGGLYHNAIQNPSFDSTLGRKYQSDVSFTFADLEKSYSTIDTARLYAVLYDNRDSADYFINISVDGNNDGEYETIIENNHYITLSTTADSTVYKLNDNITKVYTDYCLFYDITDCINSETINVELNSSRGSIKCIGLIVAYNQDNSNKEVNYWINLGSAWTNSQLTTTFATSGVLADDVNLTQSIASSSNPTSKFNDNTLAYTKNPAGYFGIESWNITQYYDSSKNSQLINTPSGSFKAMAATLALTTISEEDLEITVDNLKASTYSGSLLALENNTIQVDLSSNKDVTDAFDITLAIADEYQSTQSVTSALANNIISLSFDSYLPKTAGDKTIAVTIDYLNGTSEELYTTTMTAYYNGYMGKSFTDGSNLTNVGVYEGFNEVNVYPISDYRSSGWTNLNYNFNLEDNNINIDSIVEVLYYQGYTYSKGFDITLKINDESLDYISSYVDEKGFGSYNYPYGLLAYNLTGKITSDNVIELIAGESNNNGLYGGYLVIITNTSSKYNVIIVSEDCDMLSTTSSSYGATSQTAISYANYNNIDDDIDSASLTIIAAGADNTVNVLFNDENLGSLGDNYNSSSQLSIFTKDITILSQDNTIAIQSINDNLYVYNSILSYSVILDSKVELDDVNTIIAKTTTVTAKVSDNDNNPINMGTVTFTDEKGTVLGQSDVIDGEASIELTYNKATSKTITATFNSDAYKTSSDEAQITVTKADTIITIDSFNAYAGDIVNITANVKDADGNPVSAGKIVFKVNGVTIKDENSKVIYIMVENGVAQLKDYVIPASWANKNISITAVYSGSSVYNSARSTEYFLEILERAPTLTFTVNQSTAPINSTVKFTVKLSADTNGNNPITTGKIIIKINGKTIKDASGKVIYLTVDENGIATCEYTLTNYKAKTFDLTAVYTSAKYTRVESNQTLTVTKQ